MTKNHDQPSDQQEIANAAYVWRKKVQSDLIEAMRHADIGLERAEFWFERFRRAYRREIETAAAAKGKPQGLATGGSNND